MKAFCGLESSDVQRVFLTLLLELLFTFCKGGTEHRVAIAGQHYFPRTEIKGDDANVVSINGETIDDTIGDVLLAHGFQHMGNDDGPYRITVR